MAQKKEQSSMSINLRLTEALTEKVVVVFLSSFFSFSSGIIYANYQNSDLPTNCSPEAVSERVN